MRHETVSDYLDKVRYTGESLQITKGKNIVAELTRPQPTGFPLSELAHLIARAPKLGNTAASMREDIKTIKENSKNKLDNPWK